MKADIRRVLVTVQSRQRGLPPAVYRARVVAETFGAELVLTTSIYDSSIAVGLARGNTRAAAARDGMIDAERQALGQLTASLRDWGIPVELDVRWHTPAFDAVLRAVTEQRADLVVVDALEPRPIVHTRLTDTDWQLMRLCPCPVLYVNEPDFSGYDRVLAAVDPLHPGSATARTDRAVIGAGAAFAGSFGCELHIVHAYPDPDRYGWISSVQVTPGVYYGTENIGEVHRQIVQDLVDELRVQAHAMELRSGDPSDVLTALAAERGSQLIVLGALERSAVHQALLGSTAESIVAAGGCDVLLVKPSP